MIAAGHTGVNASSRLHRGRGRQLTGRRSQRAIGQDYGVSGNTIRYIQNRETWAHVED